MASTTFNTIMIAAIIAVTIAPSVMAVDYIVDWNLYTNYAQWAAGKEFFVGDTLTFVYKQGNHNVQKVTGPDFLKCNTSASLGGPPMTSGNDLVHLAAAGRKWYICGVGNHCTRGMKLVITVNEAWAPAPAPEPTSGTSTWAPVPAPAPTEYENYGHGRKYRWFGTGH